MISTPLDKLKEARETITEGWGAERAADLFETKPDCILENKAMPADLYMNRLPGQFEEQSKGKGKKKGFFANLFG